MTLKELKKMIAEEYTAYLKEQGPAGPPPGMPKVAVSDADVDATGGADEDAEATLKDIYDMLKDFFEGDDAGADKAKDADDADDAKDAEEDGEEPDDKSLQERFKKLANIIKG